MKSTLESLRYQFAAVIGLLSFSLIASAEMMMPEKTPAGGSVLSFVSLQEPAARAIGPSVPAVPPGINTTPDLGRITIVPLTSSTRFGIVGLDAFDSTNGLYDPDARIKQFAMRSKDATTNFIWLK